MKMCVHLRIRNFENCEEDIEFILPQERMLNGTVLEFASEILKSLSSFNLLKKCDLQHFASLPLEELFFRESIAAPALFENIGFAKTEQFNNEDEEKIYKSGAVKEEQELETETVYFDFGNVDGDLDKESIVVNREQLVDILGSLQDSNSCEKKVKKRKSFHKKQNCETSKRVTLKKVDNYICQICYRSFARKGDLENHVRVHDDSKPFICSQCGKSFRQLALLLRHGQVEHENKKTFKCSFCGKSFGYKRVLTEHMRVHSGEKPYKCDKCEHRFTQRSNMKKHIKLNHSLTRDFKCDECSKQFVSNYYLKRHLADVHKMQMLTDGETPAGRTIRCPFCTVTTKTQETLQEHISSFHSDSTA